MHFRNSCFQGHLIWRVLWMSGCKLFWSFTLLVSLFIKPHCWIRDFFSTTASLPVCVSTLFMLSFLIYYTMKYIIAHILHEFYCSCLCTIDANTNDDIRIKVWGKHCSYLNSTSKQIHISFQYMFRSPAQQKSTVVHCEVNNTDSNPFPYPLWFLLLCDWLDQASCCWLAQALSRP